MGRKDYELWEMYNNWQDDVQLIRHIILTEEFWFSHIRKQISVYVQDAEVPNDDLSRYINKKFLFSN